MIVTDRLKHVIDCSKHLDRIDVAILIDRNVDTLMRIHCVLQVHNSTTQLIFVMISEEVFRCLDFDKNSSEGSCSFGTHS